jgi:hypothetical protein
MLLHIERYEKGRKGDRFDVSCTYVRFQQD